MEINTRHLIRNFAIEIILYGILVAIYFFLVLRALSPWLTTLYDENLTLYAFVALLLIVAQSVVLEWITAFLVERLGLERLE
ncbi:MAG: hypothetical protein BMS9Abin02_0497 [Anaerolineae bacterium]|nr:MAG: hypothetical protein BMS9Abin02_0497 [Anaerolineae bacterium]